MSERKDGGPAFPSNQSMLTDYYQGMSLRDYFAAASLNAIVAGRSGMWLWEDHEIQEKLVREAYLIADAMLAERDKNGR